MKNIKRIIAWIGIIFLIALYVSTLVFALSSNPNFMNMLMISIVMTIIIPIIIWLYTFIYDRILARKEEYREEMEAFQATEQDDENKEGNE